MGDGTQSGAFPDPQGPQVYTLVFVDGNETEVFFSVGETASAAAKSARGDNPHLAEFRCVAAIAGKVDIMTAPSHACLGEDVFD